MKKALVYFNGFADAIGGSECLVFSVLGELLADYDVTLALADGAVDPRPLSARYGIPVVWERVRIVDLRPAGLLARLDRHLRFVRWMRLRACARGMDLCVSCANPVDFGRPGVHFVFMMSFDRPFQAWAARWELHGWPRVRHGLVACRDALVFFLSRTRTPRQILRDPRERVYPNSAYVRGMIERHYGCRTEEVFYPPTLFETELENRAPRERIGYLGRICPEKRIVEMAEIVRRARVRTGRDLTFQVAGVVPDDAYGCELKAFAAAHPWFVLHGPVVGEAKRRFLAACALALHAATFEAFGIAIAECLKAGVVPVVPREGGAAEVVGDPSLCYATADEAADLLARLVADEPFFAAARRRCAARAGRFAAAAYRDRQHRLFASIRAERPSAPRYVTVTPFFPSPASWRGGYCLDFVKRLPELLAAGDSPLLPGGAAPGSAALAFPVFVPGAGDYEIEGVRVYGFRERRLPGGVFPFLFARRNARAFLRALARAGIRPADVVACHAHTARYGIYPLAVKRLNPSCRTVLHHHELGGFGLQLGRLRHCWLYNVVHFPLFRRLHERIDHHVFVSERCRTSLLAAPDASWSVYADYRRQMRGLGFFRPARFRSTQVLHNVIDEARFAPAAEAPRRRGGFVIGCVANFFDMKDQLTLLRAASRLAALRRAARFSLVFVGTGPLRARCEAYAAAHRIDATFIDELPRAEMPAFYRTLDLFVLPSVFEAFGCVFLEAQACGVPFVTCEGQGMDDFVPPSARARQLCRPYDPADLAAKIAGFMDAAGRDGAAANMVK